MKKAICLILALGLMGILGANACLKNHNKETTVSNSKSKSEKKRYFRCWACNGTGFTSNSKGERGKGNTNCAQCKGTGRM